MAANAKANQAIVVERQCECYQHGFHSCHLKFEVPEEIDTRVDNEPWDSVIADNCPHLREILDAGCTVWDGGSSDGYKYVEAHPPC